MSLRRGATVAPPSLLVCAALISACGGDGTAPPKPTQLVLVTAPSAIAETMIPLLIQPVVQTTDASGQAVPTTATITADVLSGNGTVVQSGIVRTDATGRAAFAALTLGAMNTQVGPLALQFSAPGLEPVVATVELRCAVLPLVVGQAVNRSFSTGDCGRRGSYQQSFRWTTSQPLTAVNLATDAAFRTGMFVRGANEPTIAWGYVLVPGNTHLEFNALVPAGDHLVLVSAPDQGQTGPYSLQATTLGSADLNCAQVTLAASPITTTQALAAGDCAAASFFQDFLLVGLPDHSSITASMISSAFQPVLNLLDATSSAVAMPGTAGNGSSSITFTNGDVPTGFYLMMSSSVASATGSYSLTLNITYPTSNSSAMMSIPDEAIIRKAIAPPNISRRMQAAWSTGFRYR